jgi:hypothetical protein
LLLCTITQGPPGTGKTRTLAAMVRALCKVFHDSSSKEMAAELGFALPKVSVVLTSLAHLLLKCYSMISTCESQHICKFTYRTGGMNHMMFLHVILSVVPILYS